MNSVLQLENKLFSGNSGLFCMGDFPKEDYLILIEMITKKAQELNYSLLFVANEDMDILDGYNTVKNFDQVSVYTTRTFIITVNTVSKTLHIPYGFRMPVEKDGANKLFYFTHRTMLRDEEYDYFDIVGMALRNGLDFMYRDDERNTHSFHIKSEQLSRYLKLKELV